MNIKTATWLSPQNKHTADMLLAEGFEFIGTSEDMLTPDCLELIVGCWSIGVIACERLVIVVGDGAVFGRDGADFSEDDWQRTKQLVKRSLISYQPTLNHTQLCLF